MARKAPKDRSAPPARKKRAPKKLTGGDGSGWGVPDPGAVNEWDVKPGWGVAANDITIQNPWSYPKLDIVRKPPKWTKKRKARKTPRQHITRVFKEDGKDINDPKVKERIQNYVTWAKGQHEPRRQKKLQIKRDVKAYQKYESKRKSFDLNRLFAEPRIKLTAEQKKENRKAYAKRYRDNMTDKQKQARRDYARNYAKRKREAKVAELAAPGAKKARAMAKVSKFKFALPGSVNKRPARAKLSEAEKKERRRQYARERYHKEKLAAELAADTIWYKSGGFKPNAVTPGPVMVV